MKSILLVLVILMSPNVIGDKNIAGSKVKKEPLVWVSGMDVESFWLAYADSTGGLTWAKSSSYPEYAKVKEGDTLLIEMQQGVCLMEFFHSRWRRANDVRRWHQSINDYGACPYVFD